MKQLSTLLKEEKEQNNSVALGRNRIAKVIQDGLSKSQGSATSLPGAMLTLCCAWAHQSQKFAQLF